MSGIPAGAGQLLGKRLGKFEILALLALGGTAEIYLARIGGAAGFEKYVVVKCLHDHLADDTEFVKMFLDEARLAAHLDHSNIVQTMELGQYDGRYYMVMEFLAGLSLAMIVRRVAERLPNSRIPVPIVLNILAQSCAGLHYAHEKSMNGKALNIVHRDISPQNLVISFEGVVKLVDFGIAKAEMRETRTRSGTIKGKFAYMSPEQCVANNVDRRTDVFALGVIAHELLTGRRLFKRPSPYETYQAVMECDVNPPSVLDAGSDAALDQVILRALTKDKEERYPTAEAFGDALLGYLHHRGIGSGPGDVARFFEACFRQELDEHSARMRELISGRDISVETGGSWGVDDPEEDAKRERAADSARRFAVSLDDGSLGVGSRVEDDDEMPAEPTRIESNPLERVNELERLAARSPRSKPTGSGRLRVASPVPRPTPSSTAASSGPGMPGSGRFLDPANSPTVITESDHPVGVPPAVSSFGNAPTGLAPPTVPPPVSSFANAPTGPASPNPSPAVSRFANDQTLAPGTVPPVSRHANNPTLAPGTVPPAASRFANVQTTLAPANPPPGGAGFGNAASGPVPSSPELARTELGPPVGGFPDAPFGSTPGLVGASPVHARVEPNGGPHAPPQPFAPGYPVMTADTSGQIATGYPVMDAAMSAQIATGASVFPSDYRAPKPGSGPRSTEPSSPREGYPVAPPPLVPGSGPAQIQRDMAMDPQRAASLMSPVGQYYPENVDWAVQASLPARAVPPWLLAILFVGALGVALGLTIVIARLFS